MTKFDLYWMSNPEWFDYADDGEGDPFLLENVPAEAKASFEHYIEQKKRLQRTIQQLRIEREQREP